MERPYGFLGMLLKRTTYLENIGITEIRFTNIQVLSEFEDIKHDINCKLSSGTL